MGGSIRLHKEHGLNPTISQCIICGGDKNEIALLGAAYKEQAPMKMVTSLEPCDECKAKYLAEGVMLVEADLNRVPNGRVAVIKEEAFTRIFKDTPIPPRRIVVVEQGMFAMLGINS